MRLRRIFAPFVLFLIGVLLTSGCQASGSANTTILSPYAMQQADRADLPAAIKDILSRGKIVIGTKFDQPLTGKRDAATGRIEGFDAEIGRIIAQRIFGSVAEGSNIEFVETPSKRRVEYIEDGTVDLVIATYSISSDRKEEVDFAGPYFVAGQTFMTRADSTIEKPDDLAGEKVCAVEGSNSLDNLKDAGIQPQKAEPLRDYSSCAAALASGQYSAVSTDNIILYGFQQMYVDEFKVDTTTFTKEKYGVGMKHDSPELREFINDTLEQSFLNGDWERAFNMTMGAADVPKPASPPVLDRY